MTSREPTAREYHTAVGFEDKLFIWGGHNHSTKIISETTILESFNVSSLTWETPQQLSGSLPDGLHSAAVTSDGENLYSFGGLTSAGRINTLYEINARNLLCWGLLTKNPSHAPQKQDGSRSVYYEDKIVVYGGFTGLDLTNDVHVFDLEKREWAVQPTTGEKPPPLAHHTFTKIDHHRAVVFGGYAGNSVLNDTYVLDMETWHWTKLKNSGVRPSTRFYHDACCIAGPLTPLTGQQNPLLMVIGGYGGPGVGTFCDVWLLDVDKGVWREITLPAAITPRRGHSAVVFGSGASFSVVILFGGLNSSYHVIAETTLLLLELRGGLWQVTKVVKPEELRSPDERLREQMKKLQLSNQRGSVLERSPMIDIREIEVRDFIGQGGFGAVYRAKWRKKTVAVKVCPGNLVINLSREIDVLTSVPPHTNIITFHGIALSSDRISTLIVTEFAPHGSLHDYLHVKNKEPSYGQSIRWAQQIANGMQHLHNNNVVHRDLKSGNILLASGLLAKICDFGTAREMVKTTNTTQKGTPRWMAPEILAGVEANINKMCDVFSYGMVLYEIFAHKIPYDDISTNALVGIAVLQGKRPPVPPTLPSFLHPLLKDCWEEGPSQRPQFKAILMAIDSESYE